MKEITLIEEMQNIIFDIAKEFHNICVRNSIPYYMLGGTMLGAIRHKGFIPWDDDMDFGVPRVYFKTLINLLERELPKHLKLLLPLDKYSVPNEILKIEDNRTLIEEDNKDHIPNKSGLFIDIFPLDNSDDNWSKFSKNRMIKTMYGWHNLKYYPHSSFKSKVKRLFMCCIPNSFFYWCIHQFISKNGNFISNYSGAWGIKETIQSKIFGEPTLYLFNDLQLYGVSNYDMYLKHIYGEYMQLPPIEKRYSHIKRAFWK